jgi:hypothetical protein
MRPAPCALPQPRNRPLPGTHAPWHAGHDEGARSRPPNLGLRQLVRPRSDQLPRRNLVRDLQRPGGHRASARVRWPPSPTLRHARPTVRHMAGFPGTDAKPSRVSRRNGSPGSGGRYSASPAKRRISANRKSNGDRCRKHRETVFSVRRRACRDRETDTAP